MLKSKPKPHASDRAFEHVKSRILSGEIDGELMSENQIADELGMSRTPVREAFLRLQGEGFMRLYPKRGALVVPPGSHENRELLEARGVIEGGAIPLAMKRAKTLVPTLREIIREQTAAAKDVARFTALDVQFHHEIVKATGNETLIAFHRTLRDRHMRIAAGVATASAENIDEIDRHHTEIVDAIEAGEGDLAARLVTDHLREMYAGVLA